MEFSRSKDAKRAGFFYFAFFLTCVIAGAVRSNLLIYADATKTAEHLRDYEWLLRISSVIDLISAVLFLMAAWALYVLLKSVDKNIALLFLLLNAAGVAVQCCSLLYTFTPMLTAGSQDLQNAFSPTQLSALNLLSQPARERLQYRPDLLRLLALSPRTPRLSIRLPAQMARSLADRRLLWRAPVVPADGTSAGSCLHRRAGTRRELRRRTLAEPMADDQGRERAVP